MSSVNPGRRASLFASLRLVPLLLLTLAAPTAAGAQPPAASRSEIDDILERLRAGVAAKRVDSVMAFYALPDSTEALTTRLEYEGYRGFDSLSCTGHVGSLTMRDDRAEAVVYREITYREFERPQVKATWSTISLRRTGGGWRITSEKTRDFARVTRTEMDTKLEPDSGAMSATAVLHIAVDLAGEDNLVLALNRGLDVTSATDGAGRPLPVRRIADALIFPFPAPVRSGDSLTIRLALRGSLFNEAKELQYSQVSIAPEGSFASWVTSWYPRLDGPGGRSPGRFSFDVPTGLTVAATGALVGRIQEGAREIQTFDSRVPRSYSFAAARYAHREERVEGVRVGVYFLTGGEVKAARYIAETGKVLGALRRFYGMYPYDGFAVVEIPRSGALFLGGSSEQGMSLFPTGILPDESFPLALVSHEMGHSWWGNFIDTEEAIVAEGLAQESSVLAVRNLKGPEAARRFLEYGLPLYPQSAQAYFQRFAGRDSIDLPIGINRPGSADGGTLHDLAVVKGHFVYDMLREEIGDRAFAEGLRRILRAPPGRRVTLGDLRAEWERASGRALREFFDQWFYRPGAPEFSLRDSVTADGARYAVRGRIDQVRIPFAVTAEVVAVLAHGARVVRIPVAGPTTSFSFHVPERPKAVLFDPDYKLLRWTADFKEGAVLQECRRLRSIGRFAEAAARIDSCMSRDEDATWARLERGLCHQETGALDDAARELQVLRDRQRLYPHWNPWLGRALLHLGEIDDLRGRRADAVAVYREALALPDVPGVPEEARRLLDAPYRTPAAPPADSLRQYEGTYDVSGLGAYVVRVNESARLCISGSNAPEAGLVWAGGARFAIETRDGYSIEFLKGPDGMVNGATVRGPTFELAASRRGS